MVKLNKEQADLKAILKNEQEKANKLKVIAGEKYKIDLNKIDAYLPRGKDFYDKVEALEKKMVEEARHERTELRTLLRSKTYTVEESKKLIVAKAEKVEALKLKLKKKA